MLVYSYRNVRVVSWLVAVVFVALVVPSAVWFSNIGPAQGRYRGCWELAPYVAVGR